jgi:hypothetical protein
LGDYRHRQNGFCEQPLRCEDAPLKDEIPNGRTQSFACDVREMAKRIMHRRSHVARRDGLGEMCIDVLENAFGR